MGSPSLSWHSAGSNSTGSLAQGHCADTPLLRACAALSFVGGATDAVPGGRHTLFLAADGRAWGVGEGGCASGARAGAPPLELPLPPRMAIASAACGWEHALLVAACGALFAVGSGGGGRLGLGDERDAPAPARVAFGDADDVRVAAAAAGGRHSLALARDGRVFSWGAARGAAGGGDGGGGGGGGGSGGGGVCGAILAPARLLACEALLARDERFVAAAAGWEHCVALSSRGRVANFTTAQVGQLVDIHSVNNVITGNDLFGVNQIFNSLFSDGCCVKNMWPSWRRGHQYSYVADNTIYNGQSSHFMQLWRQVLFERNVIRGSTTTAGGQSLGTGPMGGVAQHVYHADNRVHFTWGGDREVMTYDDAGGAYWGQLESVSGTTLTLAGDAWPASDWCVTGGAPSTLAPRSCSFSSSLTFLTSLLLLTRYGSTREMGGWAGGQVRACAGGGRH